MGWSSCWIQLTGSHSGRSSRTAWSCQIRCFWYCSAASRRRRCHRPRAVGPDGTAPLSSTPSHRCSHLTLAGAPLCLVPLYWTSAHQCRLSPVLVGGISFSSTNNSMAPWFCTRYLVHQTPRACATLQPTDLEVLWYVNWTSEVAKPHRCCFGVSPSLPQCRRFATWRMLW